MKTGRLDTCVANLDHVKAHLNQREGMIVHSRASAQIAKHHDESALVVLLFELGQSENEDNEEPEANGGQVSQEIGLLEEEREHL